MLKNDNWNSGTQVDSGMMLCDVERIDSTGTPWVRLPEGRVAAARTTTAVTVGELSSAADTGQKAVVALLCDTQEPIVVGIVATRPGVGKSMPKTEPRVAEVDGQRIELNGQDEIILRCGKASITLTKAGKIIIRGAYVSSRSSGVNRIKGGSVQIN